MTLLIILAVLAVTGKKPRLPVFIKAILAEADKVFVRKISAWRRVSPGSAVISDKSTR